MTDRANQEQIIGGRYALHGPLASGGTATVHFGRLLGTAGFARTVAIKRLHGDLLESPEAVSKLLDEARLASRIRHPNVVATLDMVAGEEEVFLVSEYVPGESLARLLSAARDRGEMVPVHIATAMVCDVLQALHAAHGAVDEQGEPLGIVHRGVTPENVLVGSDGLARLLDFGVAKGKGRLQTSRVGQLKGKVGYMAPEQLLGEEPDRRSDIYSAAVLLWEAVCGRRLFDDDGRPGDEHQLIPRILDADLVPPSVVVPSLPKVLDAVVMRGLNLEPEARYDSARELAITLEEAVGVATHRQVGEWVERLAAEALSRRAAQLRELERACPGGGDEAAAELLAAARERRERRRRERAGLGDRILPEGPRDLPSKVEAEASEVLPSGPQTARSSDVGAAPEPPRRDEPSSIERDDVGEDGEAVLGTTWPSGLGPPPGLEVRPSRPPTLGPLAGPLTGASGSLSSGEDEPIPSMVPSSLGRDELRVPVSSLRWLLWLLLVVVLIGVALVAFRALSS